MINKAPEYQAAVAAREEIVDIQAQLAEAAVHLSIRDARVEELRIQLAKAQKEIKVLKEEFDFAFDAGYDAAQESVSEWLEAP